MHSDTKTESHLYLYPSKITHYLHETDVSRQAPCWDFLPPMESHLHLAPPPFPLVASSHKLLCSTQIFFALRLCSLINSIACLLLLHFTFTLCFIWRADLPSRAEPGFLQVLLLRSWYKNLLTVRSGSR